jgi:hypothetical protein
MGRPSVTGFVELFVQNVAWIALVLLIIWMLTAERRKQ